MPSDASALCIVVSARSNSLSVFCPAPVTAIENFLSAKATPSETLTVNS